MKYIGLIILSLLSVVWEKIISFLLNHLKYIIILFLILSIAVPITISIKTSWQIPDFILGYFFILIMVGLIYLASESDRKYYNRSHRHHNYNEGIYNYDSYDNKYYDNKYYDTNNEWSQKRRNGGITDEEVKLRKKIIKKNLKNNKIIV